MRSPRLLERRMWLLGKEKDYLNKENTVLGKPNMRLRDGISKMGSKEALAAKVARPIGTGRRMTTSL